jgi:hypothetical protein
MIRLIGIWALGLMVGSCGKGGTGVSPSDTPPADLIVDGIRYLASSRTTSEGIVTDLSVTNTRPTRFETGTWLRMCPVQVSLYRDPKLTGAPDFDARQVLPCPLLPENILILPGETQNFMTLIPWANLTSNISAGKYYVRATITFVNKDVNGGEVSIAR